MKRFAKLALLLTAVALAAYGCSGGDGGAVLTGGGGGGGGTVSFTVPQTNVNARVAGPNVTAYVLQLIQGDFPNFEVRYEQTFPRQAGATQTLTLSPVDPGDYTARLLYLGEGNVVLEMFQTDLAVTLDQVASVQNPDYLPARTFTGVFTATVPSTTPFLVQWESGASGFDSAVEVDPGAGTFSGDLSAGNYVVSSPISGTLAFNALPNTIVTPNSFVAGPAITNTVDIVIVDPLSLPFVVIPAGESVFTHTVGVTPCPQFLGTYIFINNTADTLQVTPASTSQFITVTAEGTDLGGGIYAVPSNTTLNLGTQFNCLTNTGTVNSFVQTFVTGPSITDTVSTSLQLNIVQNN